MKKAICHFLVAWIFLQGSAQAQQGSETTGSGANSEIPFELRDGFLIVVEGRIAHLKGLRFVLDTGASYSVVNRNVADRLTLRRRPGKVFNFDKLVPAQWAEFDEVQFGPIEVHHVSLMVTDLRGSSHSGSADAVIGMDLLRAAAAILIDYGRRRVLFGAATANHNQNTPQRVSPYLLMEVMIQGHSVRLLVDTGMQGILLYEDRLRKEFPNIRIEEERGKVQVGYLRVKRAKLADFLVGTSESERRVLLMNGPAENLLAGIDGYMGTSTLNAQQVAIDFANNTMAWKE